jgi:hypothetical protein
MTKRILDEETRKLLQGYTPFSVDATVNFIPQIYIDNIKDSSLHPIFKIRCMKQSETTQLKANYASSLKDKSDESIAKIASDNLSIIRACILGWSNLYDSGTGEEIEFKADPAGGADKTLWEILPRWLITSLMEYVKKISGLSLIDELSLK